MEKENFGSVLREARERRHMSLAEIARKTKVPQSSLALLESGVVDGDGLPPDVFVRGFIRSYARFVGISDIEPLGLYQKALDEKRRVEEMLIAQPRPVQAWPADAAHARSSSPALGVPAGLPGQFPTGMQGIEDGQAPRRGIGLAVFVIIVLLIATITWSLFLRQPPQSGEGLSQLWFDLPAATVDAARAAGNASPGVLG